MKKQRSVHGIFRSLTNFLIFSVVIILPVACGDDDGPEIGDENVSLTVKQSEVVVRNYMNVNANLQAVRNMGSGLIPFGNGNGFNGRVFKQGLTNLENARSFTDSVWFESCADIDLSISGGNIQLVIDFGEEGCKEEGNLLRGKITEIFTFGSESLVHETIFENFSFNKVSIDGTRTASYAMEGLDTENFVVTSAEDLEIVWDEGIYYALETDLTSSFNGEEIVITGSTGISSSEGDNYQVTIDEALIYTLACIDEGIYAPVDGVETLVINNDSIDNESIIIDYGDGVCDYLVEITLNGVSMVIDIRKEYDNLAFGFIFGDHDHDREEGEDDQGDG